MDSLKVPDPELLRLHGILMCGSCQCCDVPRCMVLVAPLEAVFEREKAILAAFPSGSTPGGLLSGRSSPLWYNTQRLKWTPGGIVPWCSGVFIARALCE